MANRGQRTHRGASPSDYDVHWRSWCVECEGKSEVGLGNNGVAESPLSNVADDSYYRDRKRPVEFEDPNHRVFMRPDWRAIVWLITATSFRPGGGSVLPD